MTVPGEVKLNRHRVDLDDDGHLLADQVPVADVGAYFTAAEVEAAFQEAMAKLIGHTAHGAMGATKTFSALVGSHSGTFDANCTFTFSGGVSGHRDTLLLELTADGTSVPTWPSGGSWLAGSPPTLSTTPDERDFVLILTRDAFATWYGFPQGSGDGSIADIVDIPTAEMDTTLRLAPDGAGGVEWAVTDTVTPDAVRDAGIWVRVTVPGSSSPPDDVYSPDGTEWVYVWVAG